MKIKRRYEMTMKFQYHNWNTVNIPFGIQCKCLPLYKPLPELSDSIKILAYPWVLWGALGAPHVQTQLSKNPALTPKITNEAPCTLKCWYNYKLWQHFWTSQSGRDTYETQCMALLYIPKTPAIELPALAHTDTRLIKNQYK